MHKPTIKYGVLITLLLATAGLCVRNISELEWEELVPMLSKTSVRMWAVARGKRVYALTIDASISTYLEPPKRLKKAIELLPEI